MIFNSQLISQLRAIGCKFEKETKRIDTYRKKGTRDCVTFNRRDDYSDTTSVLVLKQAGMPFEAATEWVKQTSTVNAEASKPKAKPQTLAAPESSTTVSKSSEME